LRRNWRRKQLAPPRQGMVERFGRNHRKPEAACDGFRRNAHVLRPAVENDDFRRAASRHVDLDINARTGLEAVEQPFIVGERGLSPMPSRLSGAPVGPRP